MDIATTPRQHVGTTTACYGSYAVDLPVGDATLRHLLLVEDIAADADLIAACCLGPATPRGFSVIHVERLDAAVAQLSKIVVDCVLLDVSLSDAQGLEGVRAILGAAPDVPVVVLTSLTNLGAGEAAVRLGAQDFLVKSELNAATLRRSVSCAIDRHQQQAALRKADETLLEAMARFQRGFDSAPIGMALVALDGRFTEVNPALREMLDFSEAQLLSTGVSDTLHPDDVDAFEVAFDQLTRGELATVRMECRLIGRDDRQVWALVAAAAIANTQGRPGYLVVQAEDITVRKDTEARLVHQTLHDHLTGLPNRVLLHDRLEQCLARLDRRSESVGVFYVDVDRFKLVNDTLGHDHGDELLAEISRRLTGVIRPSDTVARVGGDEFVILAEGLSGREEAAAIAERIRVAVAAPTRLAGTDLVPSVSIGIALATDRHRRPEQILREADTAMYQAKERGKDRFEIFDDALHVRAAQHLATEALIRRALDADHIRVAYQPIIDLSTGYVVALEALMRIEDPQLGLLQPKDFLATAEDTGLIVPMGWRLVTRAIDEAGRRLEYGDGCPLVVHVNLSARQLGLPGLVEDIVSILDAKGVPARYLCVELTETILIEATPPTIQRLNQLKDLGIAIGIDDFGTGYSSLTYLRRFPVDFVKIDRTFVAGLPDHPDDVTIVKAVIGLAEALCLITIAEGVETEGQLEMLRALGCNQAQGYLLGTPELPDLSSAP